MNEIIEKESIEIENMIYEIRGVQVMLDSDIAKLYHVETKKLRSKISTANISSKSRSNPRVFKEQGFYMLATILKSDVATKVSIAIMDTFVKMRHYINYNKVFLPNFLN